VYLGGFQVHIDRRRDTADLALAIEISEKRPQIREKRQATAIHEREGSRMDLQQAKPVDGGD
jgi:hypothetical protein